MTTATMPATATTPPRPRTGTCEICGRSFPVPPRNPWKRYCGENCKETARYRRRRGLLPPSPPRGTDYAAILAECEAVDAARVPPPEPTWSRPGTAERVEVLAARVAAGLELWHPSDAGWV